MNGFLFHPLLHHQTFFSYDGKVTNARHCNSFYFGDLDLEFRCLHMYIIWKTIWKEFFFPLKLNTFISSIRLVHVTRHFADQVFFQHFLAEIDKIHYGKLIFLRYSQILHLFLLQIMSWRERKEIWTRIFSLLTIVFAWKTAFKNSISCQIQVCPV